MRPLRIATALCALLAVTSPAFALEGTLVPLEGFPIVVVWKDAEAQRDGMNLIDSGVLKGNPDLLIPLLACLVQEGTRVIVTDAGLMTHDVMVIDGDQAGCRGNIPMESLKLE